MTAKTATVNPLPVPPLTGRASAHRPLPIYVLPTRFGGAFVLVGLLTLLGCINYLLSLGYALTFLLLSVWVVCAVHASRALVGVGAELALPERAFAGSPLSVRATLHLPETFRSPTGVRLGAALIWLEAPDAQAQGEKLSGILALSPLERGPQRLPTLRLEAHDPLGLWRSSVYPETGTDGSALPTQLLICPAPEQDAPPPPTAPAQGTAAENLRSAGDEEPHGLREYRPGDAMRRVAWKQSARQGSQGTLLTRLYDAPAAASLALDWQAAAVSGAAAGDTEARLSRLCAWVLEAERRGAAFSLTLPGARLESETGETQVRRALELLARHDRPDLPPAPRRRWPWMPAGSSVAGGPRA